MPQDSVIQDWHENCYSVDTMDKDTLTIQSLRNDESFMFSGFGRSLLHEQVWPPKTINVKQMKGMNEPVENSKEQQGV